MGLFGKSQKGIQLSDQARLIIKRQSGDNEFQVVISDDKNIESVLLPSGIAIHGEFKLEAYWKENRGRKRALE